MLEEVKKNDREWIDVQALNMSPERFEKTIVAPLHQNWLASHPHYNEWDDAERYHDAFIYASKIHEQMLEEVKPSKEKIA